MAVQKGAPIVEPKGKLGVLLVGLGAVSTTFIAGVEAVKKGIGQPIGSLTQMGTVRLGKRTDNRTPLIKDFVPLARLEDLVFGAWDIFEDSAYEAATHAGVLEKDLLKQLKTPLQRIKPMKAVFDQNYVKRLSGINVKSGKNKFELARQLIADGDPKVRRFGVIHAFDQRVHRRLGRTVAVPQDDAASQQILREFLRQGLARADDALSWARTPASAA